MASDLGKAAVLNPGEGCVHGVVARGEADIGRLELLRTGQPPGACRRGEKSWKISQVSKRAVHENHHPRGYRRRPSLTHMHTTLCHTRMYLPRLSRTRLFDRASNHDMHQPRHHHHPCPSPNRQTRLSSMVLCLCKRAWTIRKGLSFSSQANTPPPRLQEEPFFKATVTGSLSGDLCVASASIGSRTKLFLTSTDSPTLSIPWKKLPHKMTTKHATALVGKEHEASAQRMAFFVVVEELCRTESTQIVCP